MDIIQFTFNPFEENTYLLVSEGEAVVVDPGCSDQKERKQLEDFIIAQDLSVKHLINTHCHIDHVLGNSFCSDRFGLPLTSHAGEQVVLDFQIQTARMYGIAYDPSPAISVFLKEGDAVVFGHEKWEVLECPGHSPAHICLYHPMSQNLIGGDVLFRDSIGRTDLPGGDYDTLLRSIKEKLFTLPDETVVYPGHGPKTTIGHERQFNPFCGRLSGH